MKEARRGYKVTNCVCGYQACEFICFCVHVRSKEMDRTALFKASVKTIRTRNKALGVKEPVKDILKSKRKRSEFETKAKDVVSINTSKS